MQSNQIFVAFHQSIMDNDDDRPVNTLDIEEASVVVVQLSKVNDALFNFVAYMPRSNVWERGRMVKYQTRNWWEIPNVGSGNSVDHYDDSGEVANPLTVLQDDAKDYTIPEIPIALWDGSADGVGSQLFITQRNLYEADKEINLMQSRASYAGVRSATGIIAFTMEQGASPIISDNIGEGVNKLRPGQSLNVLSVPGANVDSLMNVIDKNIAYLSETYSVPAYKLSVSQNAQMPSGQALIELNRPEARYRQMRAEANRANMDRIFQIERALMAIATQDATYGAGVKQTWVVNEIDVATTDLEGLDIMLKEKQAGIIDDRVIARRRIPELRDASDEEVDEYLDSLKKAPAPAPAGTGRFGRAIQAAGQ